MIELQAEGSDYKLRFYMRKKFNHPIDKAFVTINEKVRKGILKKNPGLTFGPPKKFDEEGEDLSFIEEFSIDEAPQELRLIIFKKNVYKGIEKIKKKYNLTKEWIDYYEKANEDLRFILPDKKDKEAVEVDRKIKSVNLEVETLCKKNRIDKKYWEVLQQYTHSTTLIWPFSVRIRHLNKNPDELEIIVNKDTKITDVKRIWNYVEAYQSAMSDYKARKKEIIYIDKYIKIYKLYLAGHSIREIANMLSVDYSTINQIIYRTKKRINDT